MYLIPKIMVQDEIEHHGTYIDIPRRPIHPKPLQTPHPPMYMACTRADTLLMAGSRGIGALVMGFGGPEDVAAKNAVYRKAYAERRAEDQVGFRPTEHLAALCPTIVSHDRELARRIGLRGQRFFAEALAHWYQGLPKPTAYDLSAEEHLAALDNLRREKFAVIGEDKIALDAGEAPNDGKNYGYFSEGERRLRHAERLHPLCPAAVRGRGGRDPVPVADGRSLPRGDHGDHPADRRRSHPALQGAGEGLSRAGAGLTGPSGPPRKSNR